MRIVAGLSLKNLNPRVWDPASPYYLSDLTAVMVSYAELHRMPARRRAAMNQGIHALLGVPPGVDVYLDNGAFYFLARQGETPRADYDEFVRAAQPDWYPVPQDFIPSPAMTIEEQLACLAQTMRINTSYQDDGYVPVIHISQVIERYIHEIQEDQRLATKPGIALGGIVPNLLRTPKARPYQEILAGVRAARRAFADKKIHLFGVGGTATIHLAKLLRMDSIDSSGWRNRAARGLVQLPGSGDRLVVQLGSWRGRAPSKQEWQVLDACPCPACRRFGRGGLVASGTYGFTHRATHNLAVLLDEAKLIEDHLAAGTYASWYKTHLDNTIYRPLIDQSLPNQRPSDRDQAG